MLSPKKCRELLGKEYEHLSDEELADLITQLAQVADIFIDLATGRGSETCGEAPTPLASPPPRKGRKKKMKRGKKRLDYSKGIYCGKKVP